jgi:hypothetical protein
MRPPNLDLAVAVVEATSTPRRPVANHLDIHMAKEKATTAWATSTRSLHVEVVVHRPVWPTSTK